MSALQNVRVSRNDATWEFEVQADIPADLMERFRSSALKEIGREVQLKGFRPGHAPADLLAANVGESEILRRSAELIIREELPLILAREKANIVEAPHVSLEPPQPGAPVRMSAHAPLAPEVTLVDYKKIAAQKNAAREAVSVSDDEHRDALLHFRRERVRVEKIENGTTPEKAAEESRAADEKDLSLIDDVFAQSLGFASATLFSEKVREHLQNEKELQARAKRRAALLEELAKASTFHYPQLLLDFELDEIEARFAHDLERMGRSFDTYLTETKKTKDDVRKDWLPVATERLKTRLLLAEIARIENLSADPGRVEEELARARTIRSGGNEEVLRANIAHALKNERVIEWLEGV